MRRLGSVQQKIPCVFLTEVRNEPSRKRDCQVGEKKKKISIFVTVHVFLFFNHKNPVNVVNALRLQNETVHYNMAHAFCQRHHFSHIFIFSLLF